MDPTLDNLPYQIPGPAGGLPPTPSQIQTPRSTASPSHRFHHSPWQAALRHLQSPPYGKTLLTSSIALLRTNALSNRFTRSPPLPVLVTHLSWVGRDASVTMLDPSGSIRATIHAQVFKRYRKGIEPGAALLLEGVTAVAYVERRPAGFRMDLDEGLHVSVQECHVKGVFGGTGPGVSGFKPGASYAGGVLDPPVVRRVNVRAPLRPRVEPQSIPRRPMSAPKGRPYQQRQGVGSGYQRQGPGGGYHRQGPGGTYQRQGTGAGYQRQAPGGQRYTGGYQGQGEGGYQAQSSKRPYVAGLVRPQGMQPPFKRPAMHRTNYMHPGANTAVPGALQTSRNPATGAPGLSHGAGTGQDGGLGSLTDDQLDSLLGDFDVDAAIAASGKSQAVSKPVEAGTKTNEKVTQAVEQLSEAQSTGVEEKGVVDSKAMDRGSALGTSEGRPKTSEGNGHSMLSEAHDPMIDSLLEGLDDSDFR